MINKLFIQAIVILSTCTVSTAETRENGIFDYPVTRAMHNPLFVGFDSPMWECDSIGPLYTADASAHVWADGRLYLYTSHDMQPPWGCDRMDRYHVFSTDDMVNWTDHGEILNSHDVKEQVGWGIDGWMWAPDAAYNPKDGMYYFFFPHVNEPLPWGGHDWRIGVATSRYPDRDFKVIGYVKGAASLIDPCVFIDDDGQAYLYNGGGGQCHGARLDPDDWTQLLDEPKVMDGLVDFHEGTWIHKYNGKYYLSHADNNHGTDGNCLRYAIGDSPMGPWKDMGVYLLPTGCGTSHGSIVNYKGKWYAFYHTCNYSGRGELRSVCFDSLVYNSDGTIRLVENWGSPYKKSPVIKGKELTIEGEDYNRGGYHYAYYKHDNHPVKSKYRKDDIGIVSKNQSEKYLSGLERGEWARYSISSPDDRKYGVKVLLRTMAPDARLHISSNGFDYNGPIAVNTEGEWQVVELPDIGIDTKTRYIDLRVDDGKIDVDKIILSPR